MQRRNDKGQTMQWRNDKSVRIQGPLSVLPCVSEIIVQTRCC
jgi:hypothetical protein